MWKLSIDETLEKEYRDKMITRLVKRIQLWNGKSKSETGATLQYKTFRSKLLPDWEKDKPKKTGYLEMLLIAKPKEAYDLNNKLMKKYIDNYCENDLTKRMLPAKYRKRLPVLERIFDYDGQISESKHTSYWLAEMIGHNTCTYCNRQYTFTVTGKNNGERITRPAFDHWFPKSLFPLLSLNIYNLIPSCTICNSGAKGDTIFTLGKHIHPYTQVDDDPGFKFVPQVSSDGSWHVILDRDAVINPAVDNTIKAFALDRIYDMHGPLEVTEMMEFAQAYNENYLQSIYQKLKQDLGMAGYGQDEIYRMLFGTESIPEKYLDRPLSKMKHDILEFLHIL